MPKRTSSRLTDAAIRKARPAQDGSRRELWDGDGLHVRVSRAGKVFYLRYRTPRGAHRRMKLGPWTREDRFGGDFDPLTVLPGSAPLTLAQARAVAGAQRARVAGGRDPQVERRTGRRESAPRVRDLADRFMREHGFKRSEATRRNYALIWEGHVLPALGGKPVSEVTWADVDALHQRMADSPALANRTLDVVSKAWKLASRWGWCPPGQNPGRDHDKYREKKKGRSLSRSELARLGEALEAEDDPRADVVRVLLFCGARPSEVRTLRWEHVSENCRVLDLPRTKTGRKQVYLGAPAAEVLRSCERVGEWAFPNPETGQPYHDLRPVWPRLRDRARLDCRLYDATRHTYATTALEAGVPLERVKRLVGHSTRDVTLSTYAHFSRAALLADADRVAGAIQAAMRGENTRAQVVDFPARRTGR